MTKFVTMNTTLSGKVRRAVPINHIVSIEDNRDTRALKVTLLDPNDGAAETLKVYDKFDDLVARINAG